MTTSIVVFVVSAALIAGALWGGIYGSLTKKTEGFLVALAGGALLVSALLELINPALENNSVYITLAVVFIGATTFTALDYLVKKKWGGNNSGGGLLAAITLDGIPENLALGVALIGAGPLSVAALSGSILLSNLPEAAGGAKEMAEKHSKKKVLLLWIATAAILAMAALVGHFLLSDVKQEYLNYIKSFAGGAVVASLA
ncbi:putative integral membrane protein [Nonlabens ulvanivorans]|uniref:Putative integral membrane protein n=1 Tax=Nonlabens ulvanivorans TaxID=906888 RepID=A0A081DBF2_NONUL|nr:zinc transporter [Nonlabens ulvanivorans]GAK76248.1 putative integral membrane protein [Nonlabens ulvanivorans]